MVRWPWVFVLCGWCNHSFAERSETTSAEEAKLLAVTEAAGLPPLPKSRAVMYNFYKLNFLPDGFPGHMKVADRTFPHPIYGPYVIGDYLYASRHSSQHPALAAAITVADAAIKRMDSRDGMLRFWYEPEWHCSKIHRRYISGLTQARYLDRFSLLYERTRLQRFAEAAEQIINSLATPMEQGGVLAVFDKGVVIEEAPDRPYDLTLNGWLTAILLVQAYAKRSGSTRARTLVQQNINTLRTLLPLYDYPELMNSRYRLRGKQVAALVFDKPGGRFEISSARVQIPGDGSYRLLEKAHKRSTDGWSSAYGVDGSRATKKGVIGMHLIVSLLSSPAPNRLVFWLRANYSGRVKLNLADGDYKPTDAHLRGTPRWNSSSWQAFAHGNHRLAFDIPITAVKKAVYPTNFRKKIQGANCNVYHFIHVSALFQLANETGDQVLLQTATQWHEYTRRWRDDPIYAKLSQNVCNQPHTVL